MSRVYTLVGHTTMRDSVRYVEFDSEDAYWKDFYDIQLKYRREGLDGVLLALVPKDVGVPPKSSRQDIEEVMGTMKEDWPPKL